MNDSLIEDLRLNGSLIVYLLIHCSGLH